MEKDSPKNGQIESERFFTIILSFIPGLGHLQLGLVNRGMTILVSFIGFIVMVVFITAFSGRSEFIFFLAFSFIIWIYSFFDAMKQLTKKQNGEELSDHRSEERRVGKECRSQWAKNR